MIRRAIPGAAMALLLGLLLAAPARAANLCDAAAAAAARRHGVPLEVMQAITRTETGRGKSGAPWPWTVNMEGAGHWFDSADAARSFAYRHFKRGARSFDVGCFQLNFRWHGQAFDSLGQMFDPAANADYAAGFLARLHAELGSWTEAAGAYHSRTPKFAARYKARFTRIRARLRGDPPPNAARLAGAAPLRGGGEADAPPPAWPLARLAGETAPGAAPARLGALVPPGGWGPVPGLGG